MNFGFLTRWSLRTRVTLAILAIFSVGIWVLSLYGGSVLREEMEGKLGVQQFATVTQLADNLDQEFDRRRYALEIASAGLRPEMLGDVAAVQRYLEQSKALQTLFNGGFSVHRLDAKTIARLASSTGQASAEFIDAEAIAVALKAGKSTVGRPLAGKSAGEPSVFWMTVPILDGRRSVIGALAGVTDLGRPNFLDVIARGVHGKTGGYLLVEPRLRLIVTATDRSRIMEALPVPGANPVMDRFILGYEGPSLMVNQHGVEVLTSVKAVPAAGWLVAASMSTEEAYAPIVAMWQRVLFGTALLSLGIGAVVWWMFRLHLLDVLGAVDRLAVLSKQGAALTPLPVSNSETALIFGGFNRLLATLGKREEDLRASEFRWKFALESAGEGVWDVDLATGEAHYSRRYQALLGYAYGEFKGVHREWLDHIYPQDKTALLQVVQDYVEGRAKLYVAEYRMRCKDGSYIWVCARGMAVKRGADGRPLRMIGTIGDISERKQVELKLAEVERKLWQALRQVEQKDRSRSRFLMATSHDLRQPLFAAQLLLDGLSSSPLAAQQLDSVRSVQSSLRAISAELQSLLDLSRLEDPNLQISKHYQPTVLLFEEIAEAHRQHAQQANVRLRFHPGEFVLYTDGGLLARLLGSLVDNAIKFSPGGSVLVCARRSESGQLLQVRDNGPGIADIHHRAIWEDFYQVDNEERNPDKGYGLGLAMARRIARLLRIKLALASVPGKGSVFSLLVPNVDRSFIPAAPDCDLCLNSPLEEE